LCNKVLGALIFFSKRCAPLILGEKREEGSGLKSASGIKRAQCIISTFGKDSPDQDGLLFGGDRRPGKKKVI